MQTVCDQREGYVELKLPLATRRLHRLAESVGVKTNLHQRLRHHGVDLARHDGRTRLGCRQFDFRQTRARSRTEPANIIGNLGDTAGNHNQLTGDLDAVVTTGLRFEMIARLTKYQSGPSRQNAGHDPAEKRM